MTTPSDDMRDLDQSPPDDGGPAAEQSRRDAIAAAVAPAVYYARCVNGVASLAPIDVADECYELADALIARGKR